MSPSPRAGAELPDPRLARYLLLAVIAAQLVLVWAFPRLPSQDGPAHLYSAWVFRELAPANDSPLARFFERHPSSIYPNLAYPTFLVSSLGWLTPPDAEKLAATVHVLAFPLAFFFLVRRSTGEDVFPTLFALLLSLNFFFFMGFVNFLWSVSLCLAVLALVWSSGEKGSPSQAIAANGLLLATYFAHLMGFAAACMGAGLFTLFAGRRHWLRLAASWLPAAVLGLLGWPSSSGLESDWVYLDGWIDRALYVLTFRVSTSFGQPEQTVAAVVGPVLLAACLVAIAKRKASGSAVRGIFALGSLSTLCFVLAILAPHAVGAGGFVDKRFALLGWVFALATLSAPQRFRRPAVFVVTVLALAQVLHLASVSRHIAAERAEYLAATEELPAGAQVFTYDFATVSSREVVDPLANGNSLYALAVGGANFYHYQAEPRHSGHFPIRYTSEGLERYPGERVTARIPPALVAAFADYVAIWGRPDERIIGELVDEYRYRDVLASGRLRLLERPERELVAALEALRRRGDPAAFERVATRIAALEQRPTVTIPGFETTLVGVTPDLWSFGTQPVGLLLTNPGSDTRSPRIGLALAAPEAALPAAVFVRDAGGEERLDFTTLPTREVELEALPPGGRRLQVIWSSATWQPATDSRRLGVKVLTPRGPGGQVIAIATALASLRDGTAADPARLRLRVLDQVRRPDAGAVPLGEDMLVVGASPDLWTRSTSPAGLVVRNPRTTPRVPRLRVACLAEGEELPIVAFLDDGESVAQVRFESSGFQTVVLSQVPPGGERLYLVWTDRDWSPGGADRRRLGVKFFADE